MAMHYGHENNRDNRPLLFLWPALRVPEPTFVVEGEGGGLVRVPLEPGQLLPLAARLVHAHVPVGGGRGHEEAV
eukprot:2979878-Rhodomonas_salina.1